MTLSRFLPPSGVPGLGRLRRALARLFPRKGSHERVFTEIFRGNAWLGKHSVSGPGSDHDQVGVIVRELPRLVRELGVRDMLDLPCGDFHWMATVELGSVRYIGGDIVEELVAGNQRFANENRAFVRMDLLGDALPRVDLVFCRDCLVHLSSADVRRALRNIVASGSRYLLTSHFADRRKNAEILTGEWRPLNLTRAPFGLPPPDRVILEGCTEEGGRYADKALALWRVEDVRRAMEA